MKYLILLFLSLNAFSAIDYYGAKSTEAILSFDSFIEVETSRAFSVDQLNGSTPKAQEVQQAVHYQISFLIGHFQSKSFISNFRYPGVIGDDYEFQFFKVSDRVLNRQKLYYRFKGKTNFHSRVFSRSSQAQVPIRLPVDPYTIYSKSVIGRKNKCTDDKYNSEGDFFYFWDVELPGCPLKGDTENVIFLNAQLNELNNTRSTYPEFDKLHNQPELRIALAIGYIDDVNPSRVNRNDAGYISYEEIVYEIKYMGFSVAQETRSGINFYTRLEKTINNHSGMGQKVVVDILLTDPSSESDRTFKDFFKNSLENSHIVAYDGHSGLGGYLDINRFSGLRMPSFYQIYFFNGCSSYPYFNSMYFNAKPGGSKNLEIITSGLPTLTSTSVSNMMAFLNPFLKGHITSYQTLLNNMESSNGDEETYLMGVNGDEDNRFRP